MLQPITIRFGALSIKVDKAIPREQLASTPTWGQYCTEVWHTHSGIRLAYRVEQPLYEHGQTMRRNEARQPFNTWLLNRALQEYHRRVCGEAIT